MLESKLSNVDSRYAAVKDVFKLAFVADRISGGILSSNVVIEEWCRIVGANWGSAWPVPYYADRSAFTSFRDAICRGDGPCLNCGKSALYSKSLRCTDCLEPESKLAAEGVAKGDESDYKDTPCGEDLGDKGCYDCNGAVRPSSGRCTCCSALNYICPGTGQCYASGDWVWHWGSSLRPGFKASGEAAKEDVFQLLYRMRNGTLDKGPFEQE